MLAGFGPGITAEISLGTWATGEGRPAALTGAEARRPA